MWYTTCVRTSTSRYLVYLGFQGWYSGENICSANGLRMAKLSKVDEMRKVAKAIWKDYKGVDKYWIGCSYFSWTYINETLGIIVLNVTNINNILAHKICYECFLPIHVGFVNVTFWADDHQNEQEKCAVMVVGENTGWKSADCEAKHSVMCQTGNKVAKRNYRVLIRVFVCVCMCVCFRAGFCTITGKKIDQGT